MTVSEQLVVDVNRVITHVLLDANGLYGMPANGEFVMQVAQEKFTDTGHLAVVISWVRTGLIWTAWSRPLTDDELRLQGAVNRLTHVLWVWDSLALLMQAISAEAWPDARHLWQTLAPWHAYLVGICPHAEFFDLHLQAEDDRPPVVCH